MRHRNSANSTNAFDWAIAILLCLFIFSAGCLIDPLARAAGL